MWCLDEGVWGVYGTCDIDISRCMGDLTLQQLKKWMYFHKPLLLDIFKRAIFSRRHEDYVSGDRKKRGE